MTTEAVSLSSLMTSMGTIFSTAISWVGDVAETVTSEPLLLMGTIFSFAFVGVGLFKRLLNI